MKNLARVFLAGDSTLCHYSNDAWPRAGWGMALPACLTPGIEVHNHASSGRSTKSFMDEGRWTTLRSALREGDFVFIQFGHNDQKIEDPSRYAKADGDYKNRLSHMIQESRQAGAFPVLFSSLARRRFENGVLVPTHGEYPAAMEDLAKQSGTAFADLGRASSKIITELGPETSKQFFMHLAPGVFKNYPEGVSDDTHLTISGASLFAWLAIQCLLDVPEAAILIPDRSSLVGIV